MAWVPVGKVWAKVHSFGSAFTNLASVAPSLTPLALSWLERVMAWPLWLIDISTAMSFFWPPTPSCRP